MEVREQLRAEGEEAPAARPAPPGEAALWAALAGATGPADFCRAWLALQCARTVGATGGLILLESGERAFAPAALWPAGPANIDRLRKAGEAALGAGQPRIEPSPDRPDETTIAYPLLSAGRTHGVIVLSIDKSGQGALKRTLRELHWGVGWIMSLVWQRRADEGSAAEAETGAAAAMELLAAVQEREGLEEALMAFCNELCRILPADRAAIGLVRDDMVKLSATSHAAWFRKRSDLAETIEAAMDEAHDQRVTIALPDEKGPDGEGPDEAAEKGARRAIAIQHARLSSLLGSAAIASVPFDDRGIAVGVLTVERDADGAPFDRRELLFCATAAALVAPTFALRRREARLISGRIRAKAMDGAKALFGPRRPLAKALGIGALLLLAFLFLPVALFRVSADSALEGRVQRAAAAPFSGFIASSSARAGDVVRQGQVLATLDDRDLRLDHARSQSEVRQLDRQYRQALAQHQRAEMNLYGAQLRQAEAELRLIDYKLGRVNIVAPLAGVLVSGDVSQLVGSPVEEGKILFEVAPLDNFRVALNVDEGDISYLKLGQRGRFAPTGLAGRTVSFTVTKLTSVTANTDGKNSFRVEAELDPDAREILRPGMEGVAKVEIDRRSRFWIWTRGARDWLRLFLWKWMP